MAKEKACLNCRAIHSEAKCPKCGESPASDSFKGRVYIFDHENSEVAYHMKIKENGEFAIKAK
ncbi:hypothetical protein D6829_01370 [Candidatus Pacearchaeota archaeon]|nr:MAG: hypothetical protein D6829_01370 [Candidatus Pacearchaeota archaeon]